MKQKDAILVVTATAAGLYWYRCSRLPKLVYKYSSGIAAGIDYVFTAYGHKVQGTRLLSDTTIRDQQIGKYGFIIQDKDNAVAFDLFDSSGNLIWEQRVSKSQTA